MRPCRECQGQVSEQAISCPHCGAPCSAKAEWGGWGYEYKFQAALFGLPLLHVSFKYRLDRTPVVARGIFAVGEFACGIVSIARFSVGLVSVSQFALSGYALAQYGAAHPPTARIGPYVHQGRGQLVRSLAQLTGAF